MRRKGPSDTRNVRITALANDRKRPGRRVNDGDKQYERRRYMKYAGCNKMSYVAFNLPLVGVPRGIDKYA